MKKSKREKKRLSENLKQKSAWMLWWVWCECIGEDWTKKMRRKVKINNSCIKNQQITHGKSANGLTHKVMLLRMLENKRVNAACSCFTFCDSQSDKHCALFVSYVRSWCGWRLQMPNMRVFSENIFKQIAQTIYDFCVYSYIIAEFFIWLCVFWCARVCVCMDH